MPMTSGNRSRQFRRVSTNAKDFAKQLADLDAWDASRGYVPNGSYTSDGKSAFHGKQIPELERAVEDIEAGDYDVLVFWAADRMWRGKSLARALGYVERIYEAGGSVEFVKDPHLNVAEGVPAYVRNMLMAQAFGAAHAESVRKSQRTSMDIAHKQATRAAHGRPAWGYRIEGPKDGKRTVRSLHNLAWLSTLPSYSARIAAILGRPQQRGAASVAVFGGIVAGAGLAIAVVYLLAAGSQTARLVWNLAPSKLGLLAGFTLLGAGVGLMLAAVTSKKS